MKIFSISEISNYISQVLKSDPYLGNIWVEGEVSNYKRSGAGHIYFSLKDEKTLLSCVVFRTMDLSKSLSLKNGIKIQARGGLITYSKGSNYQLLVKEVREAGIGDIYQRYIYLKNKYTENGYFSDIHKKELVKFPKRIGVITSPTGAAIKDIIQTIKRRYPVADITLYPVVVQGENAPYEIIQAIEFMDFKEYDVLIVGRGGGSFEDLNAFNNEELLQTIFDANTPIVSAVGHETDFMLTDFIADVRASTPTAAAELTTPDICHLFEMFTRVEKDLELKINQKFDEEFVMLDYLQKEIQFKDPEAMIQIKIEKLQLVYDSLNDLFYRNLQFLIQREEYLYGMLKCFDIDSKFLSLKEQLNYLKERMDGDYKNLLNSEMERLAYLAEKIEILNPKNILKKGYAKVYKKGQSIHSIESIEKEDSLCLLMADGKVQTVVQRKEKYDE